MSIRVSALYLLVAFLSIYAYRDWFKSLCGLILLMAVIQHPDMPRNIMGIQGLNPWNILFANVLLGWLISRGREGLVWDMPRSINVLLVLYLVVLLVAFCRMFIDRTHIEYRTSEYLIGEYLVNTIKWVVPGLLLFDGCRSRRRLVMALTSVLAVYFLFALLVIRWMPPSAALSVDSLEHRSYKIIQNEIGYSRVNMSRMLAGGSWAMLAMLPLTRRRWQKVAAIALFLVLAYAQALTGGRMGYVTWGMIGLILCALRWRKSLPLVLLVPILVAFALPGVRERMLTGFGQTTVSGETAIDDYELTAGRTLIWPHVIDKIGESPIFGYGRLAMARTGLTEYLRHHYGKYDAFPHPHNAYLEMLLDNGLIGFVIVMPFYAVVVIHAMRLFTDRGNSILAAVGGVALALLLALLVASMGSQTFYPREAEVGMWAAIGLAIRTWVSRIPQAIRVQSIDTVCRVGTTSPKTYSHALRPS